MQGGGERRKGGLWGRDAWRLEVKAAWELPHLGILGPGRPQPGASDQAASESRSRDHIESFWETDFHSKGPRAQVLCVCNPSSTL